MAAQTMPSTGTKNKTAFQGLMINGRYRILCQIAHGSFGIVFKAVDIDSGEAVAVKMESNKCSKQLLEKESKIYYRLQGQFGIPQIRWFGLVRDYNALVMDLLGPSLEDIFYYCNRRFSLKTVVLLADQMIGLFERLHSNNIIHRDIKPDNFTMGASNHWNRVYMIDFGLSNKFRDVRSCNHIPYRERTGFFGTARYASINALLGNEQSRRDDMEALGYVFLYFLHGSLPWHSMDKIEVNNMKNCRELAEKKKSISPELLCKGYPTEFATYLKYCRELHFEQVPDYFHLRQLFRNVARAHGYKYDYQFDWRPKKKTDLELITEMSGLQIEVKPNPKSLLPGSDAEINGNQ